MNNKLILGIGAVVVLAGAGFAFSSYSPDGKVNFVPEGDDGLTMELAETKSIEEQAQDHIRTNKTAGVGGNWDVSYAHTAPGKYSEIYSIIRGLPKGTVHTLILRDENGKDIEKQTVDVNNAGNAQFTWRITNYGTYEIYDPELAGSLYHTQTLVVE